MAATQAGAFQARRAKLEKQIDDLNEEIRLMELERDKVLSQGGPRPTGDRGYLPRYYRYDAIMRDRPRVEAIFDETIRAKNIRDPQTGEPIDYEEPVIFQNAETNKVEVHLPDEDAVKADAEARGEDTSITGDEEE